MDRTAFINAFTSVTAVGQQEWITPGSYTFLVPAGVTSISAVAIGGGQAGGRSAGAEIGAGGQGGDLRLAVSIPAIPGETLTVVVGAGGIGTSATSGPINGVQTQILRDSTVLLSAKGGGPAGTSSTLNVGAGILGGNGGVGGTSSQGSGGGGTGGYGGTGAAGTGASAGANSGAGGGGAGSGSRGGGGGGGVGIYGAGSPGAGGNSATGTGGGGGSGGTSGETGISTGKGGGGGTFGGGGGGSRNGTVAGGNGGGGAVRIIYPASVRSYPSTMTQDI